ncbi:MAG: ubiquinol oxidase subunit [Phenylobacterium sp.]|jgi:cytochrome o ubiquinol oxidase subunit 2|nr:ubiquinol oxidase subunit [Phenylobacterium sp.]MDB5463027.1 ubiquinol oxidase subunit [Phenylobacterium sp.]
MRTLRTVLPAVGRAARRAAMLLPLTACLGGCREGVLAPMGPIGGAEDQILWETFGAMLLVVVPVILATLAFAWWFRASNPRATYRPDWSYSGKIEFTVWMTPLLLILFLATLAWSGSHDLDPYRRLQSDRKPIRVEVISLDWKWLFVYPDYGVASVNELAVPVGTPVDLRLTSGTVMNSFFVPRLGSQIYTMAGMQTRLSLQADRPGAFRGLSTQFSGDGFSDMRFTVRATDGAGFANWIAAAKASAGRLDNAGYDRLAATHAAAAPTRFGAVEPGLFDHAVAAATSSARRPTSAMNGVICAARRLQGTS